MKSLNLTKIILIVVILFFIFGMLSISLDNSDIESQEDLSIRENNIKEIAKVFEEEFYTIGYTESAYMIEEEAKVDGTEIRKDYYFYGEEGKSLVKIKEYEGIYEKSGAILKKEIYIDLSKKVDGVENVYSDVTIINIEDWTSTIIDNYEFKTPIEKIRTYLNKRYNFEKDYKEIALDKRNELYVNNWPKLNHRSYGWSYEIKENDELECLSFSLSNEEKYLYFDFEVYENNKRTEKTSIQISKLQGCLDDVTVPEL